jgi:tetratricopeptide (TPR) repeat protein
MASRFSEAVILLNDKAVENDVDAMVWRAIANHGLKNFVGAKRDSLAAEPIVDSYPLWVRNRFYLAGAEAAIETGDIAHAARLISLLKTDGASIKDINELKVILARIDAAEGRFDQALDGLGQVIATDLRSTRASAVFYTLKILQEMGRLDVFKGAETLAAESIVWRDSDIEIKMSGLLGDLYFSSESYREAFEVTKQLVKNYPESEDAKLLLEKAQQSFTDLFLNGAAESLAPIKALSLYYDYRYLTPVGARGDEMIRNLAKRLVKVDLLEQAAELLQYQVDERLDGVAKAQIATDLAVIYLANRLPNRALEVLHDTRLAGIPLSLQRQRKILEGKALIDVNREELALDILSSVGGRDADLLKIEAHWRSKRYQQAAETIENLYESDLNSGNLSVLARANIIKAGVGFVLAQDRIGLARLRIKYAEQMSKFGEWGMFDFVTGQVNSSSLEFKKVAQEVAGTDSLKEFLRSYNESYGADGALTPIGGLQN